jgi:hypothetical protein
MLLYLAYRDRYNNFEVYQLRSVLNKAGVCSLDESKKIAEKLFKEAFVAQLKLNKLRVYPSLKTFLYGDRTVRPRLVNVYGLEFDDIINLLFKEEDNLKIQLFAADPSTGDRQFKYVGRF